ncbi:MAG: hypothetical protein KA169_18965 [Burkholderiaceae bacterium]|nr:hypothetical protein [Burkholderiaceae bacterium]
MTEAPHLQHPFTTRRHQADIPHELDRRPALPFEQIARSPPEIVERIWSPVLLAVCRSDDLLDAFEAQAVLGRDVLCRFAGPAGAHDPRVPWRFDESTAAADMRTRTGQRW